MGKRENGNDGLCKMKESKAKDVSQHLQSWRKYTLVPPKHRQKMTVVVNEI